MNKDWMEELEGKESLDPSFHPIVTSKISVARPLPGFGNFF